MSGFSLNQMIANNTTLQLCAFALFASLIPLFSVISVVSIRRTAAIRRNGLTATFPALKNTTHYRIYGTSESRSAIQVKTSRYTVPILFLFLLNMFMSVVLLDMWQLTDNAISEHAKVFILCGGRCTDLAGPALVEYQTQTFVAASYAFLGWMVWTFTTIFDRAGALQLFPSTFNRLLIRLVIAVLVAIVVRHLMDAAPDMSKSLSGPPLSFAIGMFPETGLTLIVRRFREWARSEVRSEDFPLELIEGVTPAMTYRLDEMGISDSVALASASPFTIFDASLTPMSEIVDWIAQAHLLVHLKTDRFQTMQKAGYRTIFDLIRLLRSPNGAMALRVLCNWDIPEGYDAIAAIQADADFKRLAEVYAAIGGDLP